MKNKAGIFGGFAFGMAGFLLIFKIVVLKNIPPSDEIPPGLVMLTSIFVGLFFAFVGHLVQNRFGKRTTTTESE